ncbi:hypothetical protein SAMN02745885_00978 [Carboxydocella sporoproducens DSM 16521]|uniref:Uncharacterized protein n=2 Tax=Carboxydocella TaxID=178898 RepID=A0A1T4NNX2_9FIRM|nr:MULTISPECIES: hypothetical protein [Carboxydocella]AVX20111.1 hypothetical protein CFE_0913 [Carboxydocella thermautotrophica]AVX30528.1 hypothetical protein CTH_0928 [Carboxydocella thermautotrophica]SJZ80478.1 hypothetical protein SAMN02745885_00978 [Carboxydocella sporoproducens DSM 16521]
MASNWDIRRIYLYLVAFATLMMMVIGAIRVVDAVVNIVYPEPPPVVYKDPISTQASKEELQLEQERQRYYRIRELISSLAIFGVATPVYLYHWHKIQRSEA